MSEERRDRIRDLHARALDLAPGDRSRFLAAECGGDRELEKEVESLLRAREGMGEFLAVPALGRLPELLPRGPTLSGGDRIGGYEIVGKLGTGGAGAVYEAFQARPRRRVALKILRAGLGTDSAAARFQDEAEILARLSHPEVATVYEAGVAVIDGVDVPWFALEYVPGARTVLEHAEAERLSVRDRLMLLDRTARAIHHGHQKGILHLDIKPGNVLVSEGGRLKVIDFGIARVMGGPSPRTVAGTVSYMSPEQCDPGGQDVDVRSDVYALGVLLYELLTGRLPHDVAGLPLPAALERIRESPPPPSLYLRSLRGDLDHIVAKALATDRERRYSSAAALADDIRRHLDHEPVEARSGGLLYHLSRFAKRRRAVFLAIATVILVSVAGAVVSGVLALEKERQRQEAEIQAYVAHIAAAAAAIRVNDVSEAKRCLRQAPERYRGWEWHHLLSRTDVSRRTISWPATRIWTGAISPDGTLATASGRSRRESYQLRTWDLASGEVLLTQSLPHRAEAVGYHPEGRQMAVGLMDGTLELRDSGTGAVVWSVKGHESCVNVVAFHRTGEILATGGRDGKIKVWSADTGAHRTTLTGHGDRVVGLAFDPTGERLASGGREGDVRIWDLGTGDCASVLTGHRGSVEAVRWSPDERRLFSSSRDRSVRIWEAVAGREVAAGRGHAENVRDIAVSPDGRLVASASYDGSVRLWSAEDARLLAVLRGHEGLVRRVVFSPDGRRVISFSADETIKLWDAERRGDVPEFRGHQDVVNSVQFSRDGRLLVSGSSDGTACVWDVERGRVVKRLQPADRPVRHVEFGPGGRRVVTASRLDRVRLWSIPEGRRLRELAGSWGLSFAVDWAGGRVYAGSPSGDLLASDLEAAGALGRWPLHGSEVRALALVPGGRMLISGSFDGELRLTSLPDMNPIARLVGSGSPIHDLDVGRRGRWGAAGYENGEIRLFPVDSPEEFRTLRGHRDAVYGVGFSPDGKRLASASRDTTVRLWDVATGRQVAVLYGHASFVRCVAWSSDGRCLASGGGLSDDPQSSAVLLWDAPSAPEFVESR